MQVIRSFQRVEISFWTAMIGFMRNQRLIRITIVAMLLTGCLSVVIITDLVLTLRDARRTQLLANNQAQTDIIDSDQSQHNMLVILVDSLSASQTRLEGLWLVGKLAYNPRLVFFPIFPASDDLANKEWSGIFGLDQEGQPSAIFLEYLRTKNIQWDNYLIVDRTSLAEFIELAGKITWDGQSLSGPAAVARIPLAQLDPLAALQAQAFVAREICRNTTALMQSADPTLIWSLLTHRMHSDLKLDSVQSARNEFSSIVGGPLCEFPTFEQISLLTGAQ
jgi:hypothetical protein